VKFGAVSGGLDSLIRLWNPNAVGNKLVGSLEGHVSPLIIVLINNMRDQLISLAENKVFVIVLLLYQVHFAELQELVWTALISAYFPWIAN